ncbi:uncharacterized protein STEHIDRAFT_115916 [Stereum hirsutum FP-91666 SS1]|uniref:Uncharacterized protein n=1 Tax=Stereum hirsutum (strain FP-91666) TaxID=721885 RepID=R7S1N4_STEHR|nr:uncharacterized protein STEHIDRAFT_115916 [Stereum hirsutum FP-91666 SS1]EIM80487.1 hypothetical protein STEHIDRAFT_115916 [Stereum hirsutum FP-91666 SS1]
MNSSASAQDAPMTSQTVDGIDTKTALLHGGYHALAFGTDYARLHFENHTRPHSFENAPVDYDGSTHYFFIQSNALGYPHFPVFLDFYRRPAAPTVIIQKYWQPTTETDRERFVKDDEVKLEDTIFLRHEGVEGALGVTVEEAVHGEGTHLKGWKETANLGDKASAQIRLWFPECKPWRRQVQTRDQTSSKNPILLKGFVQHIGRSIEAYFEKNPALRSFSGEPLTSKELIILGAVHVSAGSWQPILAYDMRKIIEGGF